MHPAPACVEPARQGAPEATAARYLETAAEVEILLKGLSQRDIDTSRLANPAIS